MKLPRLIRPAARPVESVEASPRAGSIGPAAIKSGILTEARPQFTSAVTLTCSGGKSRDHLISWEAIKRGYYAAVNPTSSSSCTANVRYLYDSVGLAYDGNIATACGSTNLSNNSVTSVDRTVLSTLNSSNANLRCGYSSSNQSIGGALDVPCNDQAWANSRIQISGTSADRLGYYLGIRSTVPQPPYFYKTNQSCTNGLNGGCDNKRIQTSDCQNDVGSGTMPSLTASVYYKPSWSSSWILV